MKNKKLARRLKIKMRIRKVVKGTSETPRLCVYRSNKQIYAQIIDDNKGVTLTSISSNIDGIIDKKATKIEKANLVGLKIAEKAKEVGVETVVFDRNGFLYHGRIKSLAEGARKGGLKF